MLGLIIFILIAIFIAVFSAFNIKNTCNVNLIFHTFNDIPVFLTILISFVSGIVVTIPITFTKLLSGKKKKSNKKLSQDVAKKQDNKTENEKS